MSELERLSRPLMKYLVKNHHPDTVIVINSISTEIFKKTVIDPCKLSNEIRDVEIGDIVCVVGKDDVESYYKVENVVDMIDANDCVYDKKVYLQDEETKMFQIQMYFRGQSWVKQVYIV